MQKALFLSHPLSGFSFQSRQNMVLTGLGRKRAVFAMGLLDQTQAGTLVSCSRQGLGREIEKPSLGHRHLPEQALSGFSSLPPKQGFGGREEKRAALKKTPEAVWLSAKKREEEKRKLSQQESPALRIRETAKRFCESSEPPPVGPQSCAQACFVYRARAFPSAARNASRAGGAAA